KNAIFMTWGGDYFNYRIVKTADLPPDRNYVVGSHPHGIMCLGMTQSFASYLNGMPDLFPGIKTWSVTLIGQFLYPLRRELMMICGTGASSKRNLKYILNQEDKGHAVALTVGGLNEAIMSAPGKYHLKLKDRKGFITVALTEGADLVPMFHFGENETYKPVCGICPKRLRNMQTRVIKYYGFVPPIMIGRSLVGLPWGGIMPLKVHLVTVVGAPIRVEKNPNPTKEEIDKLHAVYCKSLIDLFEAHKANYGIRPEQKIII
ncbi:hypothetical protein PFISCL1PPCAC_10047, partial [Pristionchus fissidentatus]